MAGSDRNELTSYRRSTCTRSEPQTKGASHGACCDRSRGQAIADLRPQRGREACRGEACPDARARGIFRGPSVVSHHPRDVRGGVPRRRPGPQAQPRCTGGAVDAGARPRRRGAPGQDGSSRFADIERGVLSHRVAVGAHHVDALARLEIAALDALRARVVADEAHPTHGAHRTHGTHRTLHIHRTVSMGGAGVLARRDRAAFEGKVANWTRSFEKSRSSVQSNATRSFFSARGSLLR